MRIRTDYWCKPGPSDAFDWQAVTDSYEPGSPIGYGATEQAAIDDLLEQIEDMEGRREDADEARYLERTGREK